MTVCRCRDTYWTDPHLFHRQLSIQTGQNRKKKERKKKQIPVALSNDIAIFIFEYKDVEHGLLPQITTRPVPHLVFFLKLLMKAKHPGLFTRFFFFSTQQVRFQ